MAADLIDLVQGLGQPHVLVVGDLMLDRYVWGNAERISQEAPVILLRADKREERLGGASSVANMLRAFGAKVAITGVVGTDNDGQRIRQMLLDLGIDQEGILADPPRPSTVKERYIGRAQHRHPQQMIRVDYEARFALAPAVEEELVRVLQHQLRKADIVLVSDYDKGVCTPGLLANLIAASRSRGVRVLADPVRGQDYRKYHGCSAITPNRLEASLASGRDLSHAEEVMQAAAELRAQLALEAAIITLDKEGMALAHQDGRQQIFPTRPRQVYDITGAGDMVLSVLGMALAAGADYDPAIRLANIAGGLEVEKIGVATVTRDEILRDLLRSGPVGNQKLLTLEVLRHEIESRRRLGQRVAFTYGTFDTLHANHVQYLQAARAEADVLVVGLNKEGGAQVQEGTTPPANSYDARCTVLAALHAVDYLTIYDEPVLGELIQTLRPDVLVKEADHGRGEPVGAELVASYGGRVHVVPTRSHSLTEGIAAHRGAA
jgi:D-beta-D-heptose 7-phosphate kinase/D-beta-D-heptose 1-phosphate adenosyltransferase